MLIRSMGTNAIFRIIVAMHTRHPLLDGQHTLAPQQRYKIPVDVLGFSVMRDENCWQPVTLPILELRSFVANAKAYVQ